MRSALDQSANAEPFLRGVRVVELGRGLAAPLAGMILAEQGAEVVRIVHAGIGPAEPVLDAMLARGKIDAQLDLGSAGDRDTLRRLLEHADVLIVDLATDALVPAGLSVGTLRAESNPGLVRCSIPSFPATDPRAAWPDHEAAASAAGYLYDKPIGAPRYHALPVASVMAALFASCGVVAALIARLKSGRGQDVRTSVFEASVFAQILPALVKTGVPRGFLPLKMVGTPFMSPCRHRRNTCPAFRTYRTPGGAPSRPCSRPWTMPWGWFWQNWTHCA